MTTQQDQEREAFEDAAYECLSALAGIETHDVNLRDHPNAWDAIEAFVGKLRAALAAYEAKKAGGV